MSFWKFFNFSRSENRPEGKPAEVTFSFTAKVDELEQGLRETKISAEQIQEAIKSGIVHDIEFRRARGISQELLKRLDMESVMQSMLPEVVKAFSSPEFIKTIVDHVQWHRKEEVLNHIDWNQLTPVLTALVTKQLADRMFSR